MRTYTSWPSTGAIITGGAFSRRIRGSETPARPVQAHPNGGATCERSRTGGPPRVARRAIRRDSIGPGRPTTRGPRIVAGQTACQTRAAPRQTERTAIFRWPGPRRTRAHPERPTPAQQPPDPCPPRPHFRSSGAHPAARHRRRGPTARASAP